MTAGQAQDPFLPAQPCQLLLYVRAAVPGPDGPVQFLLQALQPQKAGRGGRCQVFQLQGDGTEFPTRLPQQVVPRVPGLFLPGRDGERRRLPVPGQAVRDTDGRSRAGGRQQEEQISLNDRNHAEQQQEQAEKRQGRQQAAGNVCDGDRGRSGVRRSCRIRQRDSIRHAQGSGQFLSADLQGRSVPFLLLDFLQQLPVFFFQSCLPGRGPGKT